MALGNKPSKIKNPDLSQEMIDIIERSHRQGDGLAYDDIDSYKYIIMDILTKNQDILKTLHNKDFEQEDKKVNGLLNGDLYKDVNIFNFLKIPDTQSVSKNYICFEVDDIEQVRYNEALITKQITFRTVSFEDDVKTDWGIARQDLLAMIIKSEFDWSNIFGMHISKVYDKGRVSEDGYYYREVIYETTTANNLVNKMKNGGFNYGRYK